MWIRTMLWVAQKDVEGMRRGHMWAGPEFGAGHGRDKLPGILKNDSTKTLPHFGMFNCRHTTRLDHTCSLTLHLTLSQVPPCDDRSRRSKSRSTQSTPAPSVARTRSSAQTWVSGSARPATRSLPVVLGLFRLLLLPLSDREYRETR